MNEEREVYSMKGKGKRVLSGLLSLLTILTSVIQPVVTYAAEPEPPAYEAQYPSLETVREFLDVESMMKKSGYPSMKQKMKPGRIMMGIMRILTGQFILWNRQAAIRLIISAGISL